MSALVIRSWKAADTAFDDKGTFVSIHGRKGGLVAWLLALVGVDPVTTLRITGERMELRESSLAGWKTVILPLENVDYIYHGYHSPWKKALVLFCICMIFLPPAFAMLSGLMIPGGASMLAGMAGLLVSTAIALLYFFLERCFVIGLASGSGDKFDVKFKRSIVESHEINAKEAAYICDMVDYLCDCRRTKTAS